MEFDFKEYKKKKSTLNLYLWYGVEVEVTKRFRYNDIEFGKIVGEFPDGFTASKTLVPMTFLKKINRVVEG